MKSFLPKEVSNDKWGSVIFSDKYPSMNKELYESVALTLEEILQRNKKNSDKSSILIFMPGLAEIEQLSEFIRDFFQPERCNKYF